MLKKLSLGVAALAATFTALPTAAQADHGHRGYEQSRYYDGYDRGYSNRRYRRGDYYNGGYDRGYSRQGYYDDRAYYDGRRYRRRCGSGTTGAIVGGAAGALLGREIGRGGRSGYYGYRRGGSGTTGAILGGAAGALLGREIGRSC